jgi:hypothetical protein
MAEKLKFNQSITTRAMQSQFIMFSVIDASYSSVRNFIIMQLEHFVSI